MGSSAGNGGGNGGSVSERADNHMSNEPLVATSADLPDESHNDVEILQVSSNNRQITAK